MANITILASKVGRVLDVKYLQDCPEGELRQLQDNLIESYNSRLKRSQ